MLPPRASFNASWFTDGNLVLLHEKFFPGWWSVGGSKLVVHIGNTPAHNSRMTQNLCGHNPLKRLPHPPYSPDIYPSDFYLFEKAKSALIGREVPDEIDLLTEVTETLSGMSDAELQRIFRSWIERVKKLETQEERI
jgi:histone-lysine N-methyltransferase SETMAR